MQFKKLPNGSWYTRLALRHLKAILHLYLKMRIRYARLKVKVVSRIIKVWTP